MNSFTNTKLREFLNEEMGKIQNATRDGSINFDEPIKMLQTGEINGYKVTYYAKLSWNSGGWRISIKPNCHIDLLYEKRYEYKWQPVTLCLSINNVNSSLWQSTTAMFYKCFDEIDSIEQKFLKMLPKLEKQEKEQEKRAKIREITRKSANTWVKELLKDSGYTYCIEEKDSKIALSVKMKNGTQLEIPVHYNRFQKIVPEVMNIIKEFERLIDENGLKVLIVNAKIKTKWTNK